MNEITQCSAISTCNRTVSKIKVAKIYVLKGRFITEQVNLKFDCCKTTLRNKQIKSGYPYAGRLDEGWSKQAPKGMTEPTIGHIDDLVAKELRRIGR